MKFISKSSILIFSICLLFCINKSLAGVMMPSDCCFANGTPGCDDLTCETAVCGADPFCCDTEWDGICADAAITTLCTDLCPSGACCLPDETCQITSEGGCEAGDGLYQGDDTTCEPDICPDIPGPENEECVDAIGPLSLNSTTNGTTTIATFDDVGFCGTSNTTGGVWYTVIGTGNTMTATTCGDFFDYDTKISVFCEECEELTCIGGNDDNCVGGANGLLSTVEWASINGVVYRILVHGFGNATGDFELTITDDGIPASDQVECSGGKPVVPPSTETDTDPFQLYSYFDLRDRESFVQITNSEQSDVTVHVQIFDAGNNCIENNFFDTYTPNDTHVYNMRDILSNNGNPTGVMLPDGAYGFVVITAVQGVSGSNDPETSLVGNFRILDDAGYEYRTNSLGINVDSPVQIKQFTFNYNIRGNITLSDVVGINVNQNSSEGEVSADPLSANTTFDVDIFNLNEVPFSCRDIVFACVAEDNLLLEQLLEDKGISVASFEYGINDSIPHSRGGELLCPGNNIDEGLVVLNPENTTSDVFVGYVGLNSGNSRGSMDSFWGQNSLLNLNVPSMMFLESTDR